MGTLICAKRQPELILIKMVPGFGIKADELYSYLCFGLTYEYIYKQATREVKTPRPGPTSAGLKLDGVVGV